MCNDKVTDTRFVQFITRVHKTLCWHFCLSVGCPTRPLVSAPTCAACVCTLQPLEEYLGGGNAERSSAAASLSDENGFVYLFHRIRAMHLQRWRWDKDKIATCEMVIRWNKYKYWRHGMKITRRISISCSVSNLFDSAAITEPQLERHNIKIQVNLNCGESKSTENF